MSDIIIKTDTLQPEWDAYLETCQRATPYQLWHWKNVFATTFGFTTELLSAHRAGKLVGVLPLMVVRSRFFGSYMTSMPGGVAADDPEVEFELVDHAIGLVQDYDLNYLVLRDSTKKVDHPLLQTDQKHVNMRVVLEEDFEKVLGRISRSPRREVTKAKQFDIHTEIDNSAIDAFYPVYLRAMREHGTPTHGLDFFENIAMEYPERFQLMVIKQRENILGGGFVFMFNGHLVCTWSGLPKKYLPLKTSYLLFWDILELAHHQKLKWVDLGRSQEGSGTFQHKKRWGAEPVQLYQQYFLNKSHQAVSTGNARNEKPLYKVFVTAWRLLPLPITEFLGPKLRSQVPFG